MWFSPFSPNIIFGISGIDSEGARIESKISVDAGSGGAMDPNIGNLLWGYAELGQNNQEFMMNLKDWGQKFYPQRFE